MNILAQIQKNRDVLNVKFDRKIVPVIMNEMSLMNDAPFRFLCVPTSVPKNELAALKQRLWEHGIPVSALFFEDANEFHSKEGACDCAPGKTPIARDHLLLRFDDCDPVEHRKWLAADQKYVMKRFHVDEMEELELGDELWRGRTPWVEGFRPLPGVLLHPIPLDEEKIPVAEEA